MTFGDRLLQFTLKAFIDLHHIRTPRADEVMVMTVIPFMNEFKAGRAISEIETLHQAHLFQHMHGPVDGGQIAHPFWETRLYLLVRHRVRMLPQEFQDGLSRTGDLACILTQTGRQLGKIRLRLFATVGVLVFMMWLAALAHVGNAGFAFCLLVNKRTTSVSKNKVMHDIAIVAPQGALK